MPPNMSKFSKNGGYFLGKATAKLEIDQLGVSVPSDLVYGKGVHRCSLVAESCMGTCGTPKCENFTYG